MLLPVVCPSGEFLEWALIELQGRIEQQLEVEPGAPVPVGTMQLSAAGADTVQLQIGYHQLEGKRVALKKPLAILERCSKRAGTGGGGGGGGRPSGSGRASACTPEPMDEDGGGGSGAAAAAAIISPGMHGGGGFDGDGSGGSGGAGLVEECHFEVVGVVRAKYLFKSRPRALISKPVK